MLGRERRAGHGVVWLLAPHLVLGTWLVVVPDHRAFVVAQVVTLAHTALALMALPLVVFWVLRHALHTKAPAARDGGTARLIRWLLAASVALACVTGAIVVWGGNIVRGSTLHAASGLLVALPLAWHLFHSQRRLAASAVLSLVVVAIAGAWAATRALPPLPAEAASPPFAFATRPTALYEPAAWCGECHVQDYADWKRSTHARTLSRNAVRASWEKLKDSAGFDLAAIGRIIAGEKPPHYDQAIFSCESCHSPTSFYGDDPSNALTATNVSGEGVTCSFCHTLRGVRSGNEVERADLATRQHGTADYPKLLPALPAFVSAPETVRPYLGERSSSWLGRKLAAYLIRWRPDVHRRDYHSPILDGSTACLACHDMGGLDEAPEIPHKTFISWKQSRFNSGDPSTTVTCQDCHMTTRLTGRPVRETHRMVPWGPERAPGRSHLLLGGDVTGASELGDADYAWREHQLNLQAVTLDIDGVRGDGNQLAVGVTVRSERVGHYLPSMETHVRYLWIEVSAVDADGKTVASSRPPEGERDFDGPSPMIFRCTEEPKPECDTLLRPASARTFTARLSLPAGAKPARIDAELHLSVDPQPIARASRRYALSP